MRATDVVHLGLMLAALGTAYLVPFELLLLSYVVLGPAHYFTVVSWLHDRKYYLPHRSVALGLAVVAVIAAVIDNASWFGFVMWSTLVVCALFAATTTAAQGAVLLMLAAGLTAVMYANAPSLAVLGILLPTLIHVSLFTLVFMILGAQRSGSRAQALLVAVYLAAIVLILIVPPSAATLVPAFAEVAQAYFANVGPALGRLLGIPGLELDTRLAGLLAFVMQQLGAVVGRGMVRATRGRAGSIDLPSGLAGGPLRRRLDCGVAAPAAAMARIWAGGPLPCLAVPCLAAVAARSVVALPAGRPDGIGNAPKTEIGMAGSIGLTRRPSAD